MEHRITDMEQRDCVAVTSGDGMWIAAEWAKGCISVHEWALRPAGLGVYNMAISPPRIDAAVAPQLGNVHMVSAINFDDMGAPGRDVWAPAVAP